MAWAAILHGLEPTTVTLPQHFEREAETLRTVKLLWLVLRLLNLLPGVS